MWTEGIIDQGELTDEEYYKLLNNDKLIMHGYDLGKINIGEFIYWYETYYSKIEHDDDSLCNCIETFLYWHENKEIIYFGG